MRKLILPLSIVGLIGVLSSAVCFLVAFYNKYRKISASGVIGGSGAPTVRFVFQTTFDPIAFFVAAIVFLSSMAGVIYKAFSDEK